MISKDKILSNRMGHDGIVKWVMNGIRVMGNHEVINSSLRRRRNVLEKGGLRVCLLKDCSSEQH